MLYASQLRWDDEAGTKLVSKNYTLKINESSCKQDSINSNTVMYVLIKENLLQHI